MRHDEVKVGQKVKIISIETTHHRHNSCPDMDDMVGKIYSVFSVESSVYSGALKSDKMVGIIYRAHGGSIKYVWAPEDLISVNKNKLIIKEKIETFDPNNLFI
jgi:hypothetical protein